MTTRSVLTATTVLAACLALQGKSKGGRDEMPHSLQTHFGRSHLVLSLPEDGLVRLLVFFRGLLQLDAVDLDAVQLGGEVLVKQELVAVVHVSPPGLLVEYAHLSATETNTTRNRPLNAWSIIPYRMKYTPRMT